MNRKHEKTKKVSYRTEVQGNVVRKVYTEEPYQQEPKKRSSVTRRKKRNSAKNSLSVPYCLFLVVVCGLTVALLGHYLELQAESNQYQRQISQKKGELDDLKDENRDEMKRIEASIDLEEIKNIALNELHMVYATEENIILYKNTSHNYVSQYEEIPQEEESLLKNWLKSE